jgi:hypothetical protein
LRARTCRHGSRRVPTSKFVTLVMRSSTFAKVVVAAFWPLTLTRLSNGTVTNLSLGDGHVICPLDPPVTVNFTLSEIEMTLIYAASKLCLLIYPDFSGRMTQEKIEDHRINYERFDAWGDWNDQAVVAKTSDGTCHAAFAGSSCWNPLDQWQNLNPLPKSLGSNSCWVRRGYFNAYNTSYKDEFRVALDSCMTSCGIHTQCDLVLSGYSQGKSSVILQSAGTRSDGKPI